jgi:ribose transport system ATP-binding protein
MDTIISMMVGRQLFEGDGPTPGTDNEIVLEVKNLNRGRVIKDVSFTGQQGRNPRLSPA